MHKTRERVVYASLQPAEAECCVRMRPTEAACFRIQKCANNCQLIVAGIQRFIQCAYTARFHVIHTRKMLRALRVYTQTVIGVFFVHINSNMHGCLTR